jgi:hypothetical protein
MVISGLYIRFWPALKYVIWPIHACVYMCVCVFERVHGMHVCVRHIIWPIYDICMCVVAYVCVIYVSACLRAKVTK